MAQRKQAQNTNSRTAAKRVPKFSLDKLMKEHHSKSNVIRFLTSKGYSRAEIADFMDIRYQHVRNVLLMPVAKPRD